MRVIVKIQKIKIQSHHVRITPEDIVPDVDMASREMRITPPKGLLELNSRSDKRSKKERHAMV
ncbi:16S rRNA processing protein RimM family, partial [Zea mays]